MKCRSHIRLREAQQGVEACNKALELDDKLTEARILLSEGYIMLEKYEEGSNLTQTSNINIFINTLLHSGTRGTECCEYGPKQSPGTSTAPQCTEGAKDI